MAPPSALAMLSQINRRIGLATRKTSVTMSSPNSQTEGSAKRLGMGARKGGAAVRSGAVADMDGPQTPKASRHRSITSGSSSTASSGVGRSSLPEASRPSTPSRGLEPARFGMP